MKVVRLKRVSSLLLAGCLVGPLLVFQSFYLAASDYTEDERDTVVVCWQERKRKLRLLLCFWLRSFLRLVLLLVDEEMKAMI